MTFINITTVTIMAEPYARLPVDACGCRPLTRMPTTPSLPITLQVLLMRFLSVTLYYYHCRDYDHHLCSCTDCSSLKFFDVPHVAIPRLDRTPPGGHNNHKKA